MEPPRISRSLRARRPRAFRDSDERFARAVEASEADRGGEFADELTVVAALRTLGNHEPGHHGAAAADDERDGSLTPAERMRITDRVLAPTPQQAGERDPAWEPLPAVANLPTPGRPPTPGRSRATEPGAADPPPQPRTRRSRVPAVAAGITLIAVSAVALGASDGARPGESLYALKQLREDASLAMTFDEQDRAFQRLGYASDRITELRSLADNGTLDRAALHTGLADFTDHTRSAVAALTTLATTSGGEQLERIRTWAGDQTSRIAPLPGAADATQLLSRVERRAAALDERMACLPITSGGADELGVLPTTGACLAPPDSGRADVPRPAPPPDDEPMRGDERASEPAPDDDTATLADFRPAESAPSGDAEPARATPPWEPAARVPSTEVVPATPEPPTGPRLPDERVQQPAELSLPEILPGLNGPDSRAGR